MIKPSKRAVYFTIRFILVHIITYIFISVIFSNTHNYASTFIQLGEYINYRDLNSTIIKIAPLLQILRALFFALILYPFYKTIIKSNYAWLKLFFLIWGFTVIGNAAPITGSIEGMIYSEFSFVEHLLVLPEITIQILVFSWFFVKWENRTERDYS